METRLLETFVAVAETGSISAAASELGYVQSSVSEQLQRLEREVGAALLVRTSTGVTPTAEGRRLLPEARRVLGAVEELRRSTCGRTSLRVGAVDTLALRWLPKVIAALPEAEQPTIAMDRRDRLVGALAEGGSDVALLYRSPDESLPHLGGRLQAAANRLQIEVLAEDELVVVHAPGAEDRDGWLVTQPGCVHREAFDAHAANGSDDFRIQAEATTPEALRQLALGSAGRALLPRLAVASDLEEGRLTAERASGPGATMEIVAVHPPEAGPEVHRFLRRAVDHALASHREA